MVNRNETYCRNRSGTVVFETHCILMVNIVGRHLANNVKVIGLHSHFCSDFKENLSHVIGCIEMKREFCAPRRLLMFLI